MENKKRQAKLAALKGIYEGSLKDIILAGLDRKGEGVPKKAGKKEEIIEQIMQEKMMPEKKMKPAGMMISISNLGRRSVDDEEDMEEDYEETSSMDAEEPGNDKRKNFDELLANLKKGKRRK